MEKGEEELKDIYYNNLNDEQKLINYLNALKKNKNLKKFESELILYFDVLSAKNRSIFTGIKGFIPSIDIFQNIIKHLSDFKFEEIKKMLFFKEYYDICRRKKFLTSKNFFNYSNIDLKPFTINEKNKDFESEYNAIEAIQNKRKIIKISLENSELYFNILLQAYFEDIEKADEERLKSIGEITRILKDLIFDYSKCIQNNNKFSEVYSKMINILLYAPIISKDENLSIRRLLSNIKDENINDNDYKANGIYILDDKLIISYSYKNETDNKIVKKSDKFENGKIYNIKLMRNEITESEKIRGLTENKLLKYVKLKYFQDNNFYTYNKDYWKFNKELFTYILKSTTIKTLFKKLYPECELIFEKEENINNLIT